MRISKGAEGAHAQVGQSDGGGQAAAAAAQESADLDEVAPEPLDMSFPAGGVRKQCTYLLLFPIIFPLWLTLPDTRRKSCKSPGKTHRLSLLRQGGGAGAGGGAGDAANGNGALDAAAAAGGGGGEDDAPPLRPVPCSLPLEALFPL